MPQVVVCGQPRCGTSMMMLMLKTGGIEVDYAENREGMKDKFRNPGGMFERLPPDVTKNFKCICPKYVKELQPDAKIIHMIRPLDQVIASWIAVQGKDAMPDQRRLQITEMRVKWYEALEGKDLLRFEYNAVIVDPEGSAARIAKWIGVPFDAVAAAKVVDKFLYINRKVLPEDKDK